MLRLAYLLTGDPVSAQDAVQSVLSRALLNWGRITRSDNVEAYLRRALINERTSNWRRLGRREATVISVPDTKSPDDIGRTDDRLALLAVLRSLPRKQRAALVLRFFDDLPDDSIAHVLGCSPATVRSHVARGLARVRATVDLAAGDPALDHALNGGSR